MKKTNKKLTVAILSVVAILVLSFVLVACAPKKPEVKNEKVNVKINYDGKDVTKAIEVPSNMVGKLQFTVKDNGGKVILSTKDPKNIKLPVRINDVTYNVSYKIDGATETKITDVKVPGSPDYFFKAEVTGKQFLPRENSLYTKYKSFDDVALKNTYTTYGKISKEAIDKSKAAYDDLLDGFTKKSPIIREVNGEIILILPIRNVSGDVLKVGDKFGADLNASKRRQNQTFINLHHVPVDLYTLAQNNLQAGGVYNFNAEFGFDARLDLNKAKELSHFKYYTHGYDEGQFAPIKEIQDELDPSYGYVYTVLGKSNDVKKDLVDGKVKVNLKLATTYGNEFEIDQTDDKGEVKTTGEGENKENVKTEITGVGYIELTVKVSDILNDNKLVKKENLKDGFYKVKVNKSKFDSNQLRDYVYLLVKDGKKTVYYESIFNDQKFLNTKFYDTTVSIIGDDQSDYTKKLDSANINANFKKGQINRSDFTNADTAQSNEEKTALKDKGYSGYSLSSFVDKDRIFEIVSASVEDMTKFDLPKSTVDSFPKGDITKYFKDALDRRNNQYRKIEAKDESQKVAFDNSNRNLLINNKLHRLEYFSNHILLAKKNISFDAYFNKNIKSIDGRFYTEYVKFDIENLEDVYYISLRTVSGSALDAQDGEKSATMIMALDFNTIQKVDDKLIPNFNDNYNVILKNSTKLEKEVYYNSSATEDDKKIEAIFATKKGDQSGIVGAQNDSKLTEISNFLPYKNTFKVSNNIRSYTYEIANSADSDVVLFTSVAIRNNGYRESDAHGSDPYLNKDFVLENKKYKEYIKNSEILVKDNKAVLTEIFKPVNKILPAEDRLMNEKSSFKNYIQYAQNETQKISYTIASYLKEKWQMAEDDFLSPLNFIKGGRFENPADFPIVIGNSKVLENFKNTVYTFSKNFMNAYGQSVVDHLISQGEAPQGATVETISQPVFRGFLVQLYSNVEMFYNAYFSYKPAEGAKDSDIIINPVAAKFEFQNSFQVDPEVWKQYSFNYNGISIFEFDKLKPKIVAPEYDSGTNTITKEIINIADNSLVTDFSKNLDKKQVAEKNSKVVKQSYSMGTINYSA